MRQPKKDATASTSGTRKYKHPVASNPASLKQPIMEKSESARELENRLLTLDELPQWAKDNPYILTSYRPIGVTYRTCLNSLTYLHNQTINIYSHLLFLFPLLYLVTHAVLVLLGLKESLTSPRREDLIVFGVFSAGGIACMAFSSCYHTFMCHSERIAQTCRQLDYTGIMCLIWSSFVPTIYYTFTCEPDLMRKFMITVSRSIARRGSVVQDGSLMMDFSSRLWLRCWLYSCCRHWR